MTKEYKIFFGHLCLMDSFVLQNLHAKLKKKECILLFFSLFTPLVLVFLPGEGSCSVLKTIVVSYMHMMVFYFEIIIIIHCSTPVCSGFCYMHVS